MNANGLTHEDPHFDGEAECLCGCEECEDSGHCICVFGCECYECTYRNNAVGVEMADLKERLTKFTSAIENLDHNTSPIHNDVLSHIFGEMIDLLQEKRRELDARATITITYCDENCSNE